MRTLQHLCVIEPRYKAIPGVIGPGVEWLVTCPTCGPVGVMQAFHADAQAIADRHVERAGFER